MRQEIYIGQVTKDILDVLDNNFTELYEDMTSKEAINVPIDPIADMIASNIQTAERELEGYVNKAKDDLAEWVQDGTGIGSSWSTMQGKLTEIAQELVDELQAQGVSASINDPPIENVLKISQIAKGFSGQMVDGYAAENLTHSQAIYVVETPQFGDEFKYMETQTGDTGFSIPTAADFDTFTNPVSPDSSRVLMYYREGWTPYYAYIYVGTWNESTRSYNIDSTPGYTTGSTLLSVEFYKHSDLFMAAGWNRQSTNRYNIDIYKYDANQPTYKWPRTTIYTSDSTRRTGINAAWSYDFKYIGIGEAYSGCSVFKYNEATNTLSKLNPAGADQAFDGQLFLWNPTKNMFIVQRNDAPYTAYLYQINGAEQVQFLTTLNMHNSTTRAKNMVWHPSGLYIMVAYTYENELRLYRLNLDNTVTEVINDTIPNGFNIGTYRKMDWSPDGKIFIISFADTPFIRAYSFNLDTEQFTATPEIEGFTTYVYASFGKNDNSMFIGMNIRQRPVIGSRFPRIIRSFDVPIIDFKPYTSLSNCLADQAWDGRLGFSTAEVEAGKETQAEILF